MSMTTSAPSGASDLYDLVWFRVPSGATTSRRSRSPRTGTTTAAVGSRSCSATFATTRSGSWKRTCGRRRCPPPAGGCRRSTRVCCRHFEPIYAVFEQNNDPSPTLGTQGMGLSPSSARLRDFDRASLQRAVFFQDPAPKPCTTQDSRSSPIWSTSFEDNEERFPAELRSNAYLRRAALDNAIQTAAAKARSNWRLAAPQFYWPQGQGSGTSTTPPPTRTARSSPSRLGVGDRPRSPLRRPPPNLKGACYRAYTVLPLDWAYRNARLITRRRGTLARHQLHAEAAGTLDTSDDDGTGTWRPARPNNSCPACGDVSGCLVRG